MRRLAAASVLLVGVWTAGSVGRTASPKFYPDDPIWHDPETQDASNVPEVDVSGQYDLIENSFLGAGDRTPKRAENINTIGEVPDSSWFTNRIGRQPMAVADLARGPDTGTGPAPGTWTILARKSEGVTPGFTIQDGTGEVYWIKFDPKSNPEMASGAEVVSTKFFHAFGYHVPENYLATFRPEQLAIRAGATMKDEDGRPRPLTRDDIDDILENAAQGADGSYRVLASRNLPGRPVGPFRYYSTRPDDPNDIFPHEHRRELRGLMVFSAWLNHDEVRSTNSLDTVIETSGRRLVRHHLLDFGSTLGSGSVKAQSRRAGNEFVWESRPTFITMLTLGLYVRPWLKVPYPDIPAVGRIESTYFRPDEWKADYPNPAFKNAAEEDRFWAARIVAALNEDAIKAVLSTAKYSDPAASEYLTRIVLERRTKVLSTWLNATNPLVNVTMSPSGELTFENAAEKAGVAKAAERYSVQWSRFDNDANQHEPYGTEVTSTTPRIQAPAELLAPRPDYVAARLRAHHADFPAWSQPLMAYFRRSADGWMLVGLERNP
ncbi:MAG: hypothetical protein WBC51_04095 [Vicinamibacterales bacterium]